MQFWKSLTDVQKNERRVMGYFDLYGFRNRNIAEVRDAVERALNLPMALHDSSYVGEYYRYGNVGEESIEICENSVDEEGEWPENSFQDFPTLLYVHETDRPEAIQEMLTNSTEAVLLRRDEL
jgi:hypothetical protein